MRAPERALLRRTLGAVKRDVSLCILMGLLWQAVAVAVPWVLQRALDQGVLAGNRNALFAWCGVLVGLGVVRWVGDAARHWWVERAGAAAAHYLRRRLVERLLAMDDDHLAGFDHGDLTARAVGDTESIWMWVSGIATLATSVFTLVAVAVLLATLDPALAVVGLASIPVAAIFALRQVARHGVASGRVARQAGRYAGVIESAVSGSRTVKGLGSEPVMLNRARAAGGRLRKAMLDLARIEARWLAVAAGIPAAGIAAGLWVGGQRALQGAITVGALVAFAGWMALLVDATITLTERLATRGAARAAARRLVEILGGAAPDPQVPLEPGGADPDRGVSQPLESCGADLDRRVSQPLEPCGADLAVDDLAARRAQKLVFSGVDLDVPAGQWLGVVGPSAAGKTTLLRLLAGLDRAAFGRVRIGGVELERISRPQLSRMVALVPQNPALVSGSVAGVLRLAAPSASDQQMLDALEAAGARPIIEDAGGLDARIGDRGLTLSGGERQRIALAAALVRRPEVLLLDDTTSALDPATEARVLASVRTFLPRAAVVIATHRAATASICDRTVMLAGGGIVDFNDSWFAGLSVDPPGEAK
ncbi:MAG: ABC transporter ATP-binding protein [Actinomycetota bacterium]